MMSESFPKIQISRMFGKDQVVLRGDTKDEVLDQATELAKESERIAESLNIIGQVIFAAQAFPSASGSTDSASEPSQSSSKPSNSGAGNSKGKTCEHGERDYRKGEKKNGDTWTAYFCPENKCEVEWGPTYKKK